MVPGAHGQPPAIQVFCEGLTDQIIGFVRRNPIVGVIAAVALAILGMAAFAHLPLLLPGMIVIEVISVVGVFVFEIAGLILGFYFSAQMQNPLIGMIATIVLILLGIVVMVGSFPDQFPVIAGDGMNRIDLL